MTVSEQSFYRRINTINYTIHTVEALNMDGIENARNIEGNYIKQELPEEDQDNEYGYFNYNSQVNNNSNASFDEIENNDEAINANIISMNKKYRPTDKKFIEKLIINEIKDINKLGIKECTICLQNFKIGDKIIHLPYCIHTFHSECIINWMNTNNICPLCKSALTLSNLACTKDFK